MFAGRSFGWMGGEAMAGNFPTNFGNGDQASVHGGGVSLLLSFAFDGDGINFTPGLCGYYIGELGANQPKGWYFVQGSGCVRWSVNDWLGFDLGSAIAFPPIYPG